MAYYASVNSRCRNRNLPDSITKKTLIHLKSSRFRYESSGLISNKEALRRWGAGGTMSPVWILKRLVSVFQYKCLSLIVGFAVTVAVWPREVVSCRDFRILRAVATFWAMSLAAIYPGRASIKKYIHNIEKTCLWKPLQVFPVLERWANQPISLCFL